ncbi:CTP synthase [Exophiala aquamarina CBS 119918]|uniref:CTP synthase n=1 Tax=Exophiala aquamarina CBS 119918 TaxID=1182545 RepID=A0A072NY37_9EURO|nr:CTP synthase [Exophiala aquamarina CBS 119918]KEF52531.1 CTP synthase [Exophiala aquamarina CBS 119918]
MKYILVSGGVISGIGKGITASSAGLLLKTLGLKVTAIKIDPYINVDAGTMAPTEHGECFVLDDGGEVDLDLGNYERYLNITLTRENSVTTGKMYQHVIERERRGDYLGKTVQVVPHVTNAIQDWIERVARVPVDDTNEQPDVCIIELGGTVGDIESAPFIEAMRQLRRRAGRDNFCQIHVSLVPVISGEQKTKPTQQAIRDARSAGLAPDLIACRCQEPLIEATTNKIALFCQVEPEQVIAVHDVSSTYHVPMLLEQQGLLTQLRGLFRLADYSIAPSLVTKGQAIWHDWKSLTTSQDRFLETEKVNIVLVGKYTNLHDSYLSVIRSLEHSAMACRRKLNLIWIDASSLEKATMEASPESYHKAWHELCTADGVLVPGGFGHRGTEGMVAAANWARTKPKPYLGICLGMQISVIEFARNVCGLKEASSVELNAQTSDPVVIFMPEIDKATMGGNMRLGLRPTLFQEDTEWSRLRKLYNNEPSVLERHRHRYEVNPEYIERLSEAGLTFIGKDDQGERMEIVELKDHPFFVGVQFHPEYLSRVLRPSPPYLGFVAASAGVLDQVTTATLAKDQSPLQHHDGVNGILHAQNGSLTNGIHHPRSASGF